MVGGIPDAAWRGILKSRLDCAIKQFGKPFRPVCFLTLVNDSRSAYTKSVPAVRSAHASVGRNRPDLRKAAAIGCDRRMRTAHGFELRPVTACSGFGLDYPRRTLLSGLVYLYLS